MFSLQGLGHGRCIDRVQDEDGLVFDIVALSFIFDKKIWEIDTVALSFVFNKYCLIMD